MNPNPSIQQDEQVVTYYQKRRLIGLPEISSQILAIFNKYAYSSEELEELKNQIGNERDYYDLVDLVNKMSQPYQSLVKQLFWSLPVNSNSRYAVKMMVDIDNTTLENATVAPITYANKQLIPGITSLLRYFSGNGATSTAFLSARPRLIERFSIDTINNMLSTTIRYSFLTGTVEPIIDYIKGKITRKKDYFEISYQKMAEEKFNNYLQLRELYPSNRFIFLGDDTQGDPYIAYKLANHSEENWAAIRRVTGRSLPIEITTHPKIFWHSSYFELAWQLIRADRANSQILVPLLLKEYNSNYNSHLYHPSQVAKDNYYINLLSQNTF